MTDSSHMDAPRARPLSCMRRTPVARLRKNVHSLGPEECHTTPGTPITSSTEPPLVNS